jgi:hypothetical protein
MNTSYLTIKLATNVARFCVYVSLQFSLVLVPPLSANFSPPLFESLVKMVLSIRANKMLTVSCYVDILIDMVSV